MSCEIRRLVAEGHLEDAIALFRDRWRLAGNVLRARLNFAEREHSAGRIPKEQYLTIRANLAKDLLAELTEKERESTS